jgi:Protein of unknown function (DUF3631)
LALWTLGTYVFRVFAYFGYVHVVSPVPQCAKSRLLDILAEVVSDSTGRASNLTESVVFHLAHQGKTFLIDEMDQMRNQDKEKFGMVMALLNAGFQAGATVYRMKRTEDGWIPERFNAYSPKAMAGLNDLSDTLTDRSFRISMTKKTASETVGRFSLRRQKMTFEALRGRLSLWAAERREKIGELYESIDEIMEKDEGHELKDKLDDRFLDISEPLISIAVYADAERANGRAHVTDRLAGLLLRMSGIKDRGTEDSALAAVFRVLHEIAADDERAFVSSKDLLAKVEPEVSWIDTMTKLANFLRRFDLVAGRDPTGNVRGYTITKEWLGDTKKRYLRSLGGFQVSEVSETHAQSGSEGNFESVRRGIV